jgi:hypothetical protein
MIADNILQSDQFIVSSEARPAPFNSSACTQDATPKPATFKLFLKPSTGQILLEESANENNINISISLRDFRDLNDQSFRKRKRVKVGTTESPEEKTCDTPTLDHQNSLTRPWSFLQVIKRKKNKAEFLKNYAFTFEELFEFESKYRHLLYDSKIYTSPDCQADLGVLKSRRFKSHIPQSFCQTFNTKSSDFKVKCAETRKILAQRFSLSTSDSHILRLMSLCPSEEIYWYILETEDLLLKEYFGTN